MIFTDEGRCSAWRCVTFSCSRYSEFNDPCQLDLCHACSSGVLCSSCNNFAGCPHGIHNLVMQEHLGAALEAAYVQAEEDGDLGIPFA